MRHPKTILLILALLSSLLLCAQTVGPVDSTFPKEAINEESSKPGEKAEPNTATMIAEITSDQLYGAIDDYYKEKFMKSPEFIICIMLLVFAIFIMACQCFLFVKGKLTATQIVRLMIITLIIISVLFLIASGYSNDQIAPAIGLLGTIAGYILGRASLNTKNETTNE